MRRLQGQRGHAVGEVGRTVTEQQPAAQPGKQMLDFGDGDMALAQQGLGEIVLFQPAGQGFRIQCRNPAGSMEQRPPGTLDPARIDIRVDEQGVDLIGQSFRQRFFAAMNQARSELLLSNPCRPDGERLQWQTARPSSADLPFLCGDITPRALRVPEGAARVHPNGAVGVARLDIAVHDLDASLARYRALFGEAASAAQIGAAVTEPGSGLRHARITVGSSTLVLSSATDSGAASPNAIARRLASRGEGPSALVLRRADTARAGQVLDIARTHGAPIRFESDEGL